MRTTCDTCPFAQWSGDTPYGRCTAPMPACAKRRDIRRGRRVDCAVAMKPVAEVVKPAPHLSAGAELYIARDERCPACGDEYLIAPRRDVNRANALITITRAGLNALGGSRLNIPRGHSIRVTALLEKC